MTTTNLHWLLLFLLFTCLHRAGQAPALVRGREGPCNYNNKDKDDCEDDDNYYDDEDNNEDDNDNSRSTLVTTVPIIDMFA